MAESERAKEILTEEVRQAAGDEAAQDARRRLDRGEVGKSERPTLASAIASNRLLLGVSLGTAVVVAVVLVMATDKWWSIIPPLLAHGVLSAVVIGYAFRLTSDVEKPGPQEQVALEAEGVADPEGTLNTLIERHEAES